MNVFVSWVYPSASMLLRKCGSPCPDPLALMLCCFVVKCSMKQMKVAWCIEAHVCAGVCPGGLGMVICVLITVCTLSVKSSAYYLC